MEAPVSQEGAYSRTASGNHPDSIEVLDRESVLLLRRPDENIVFGDLAFTGQGADVPQG